MITVQYNQPPWDKTLTKEFKDTKRTTADASCLKFLKQLRKAADELKFAHGIAEFELKVNITKS